MKREKRTRETLALLCSGFVGLMTPLIWSTRIFRYRSAGILSPVGVAGLKFFTVLSNLFNGLAALLYALWLVPVLLRKRERVPYPLHLLKYVSTAAVALTFLVVVVFLGPHYGFGSMYTGANLWFHLLLPLISMLEFALLDGFHPLPLRSSLLTLLPPLCYGLAYLVNLLVNGVSHSTDWYGFVNWGMGVGLGIFAVILLLTWGMALLLRAGNLRTQRRLPITKAQEITNR